MKSIRLFACAVVMLALLAGCDDDDAPAAAGGGATITGGVVKGPVSGSTVCAYAVTGGVKGAKLELALPAGAAGSLSGGCYLTPANGAYNFALPAGTSGDVLVEATGGKFCSNEATIIAGACSGGGTVLDLGGAVLTSVVNVSGGSTSVYTTPLTTAAVNAAAGSLSGVNFNAQFNTLAGRVIGPNSGITPATPPTATNQPYLTQVSTYLQGGGTLTAAVSSLQQGTTTFPPPGSSGSSGSTTVTGTVNPSLVSGPQTLKFYVGGGSGCGSFCSYTDMQNVTVQIFSDGRIGIGAAEYSGPFVHDYGSGPHLPEISWYDAAHDIEYALSDNEGGTFSEINVYKGRQPTSQFLGQIRTPVGSVEATLSAIAGTYMPRQQYAGAEIAWTAITIAANGQISFTGSGPTLASVSTTAIFPNVGGQVVRIYSSTDLNGHGVEWNDQIAIYLDSTNHVKDVEYFGSDDRVTGVTVRKTGEPALAAIYGPGTGTWAITPGKITGTLASTGGNTDYPVTVTSLNGSSSGFIELRAISGSLDWTIRLDDVITTGTAAASTNFSCVHGARDGRAVSLQVSASSTLSSRKGGNCNIVVTSITFNAGNANQIDAISGRFTAELFGDGRNVSYVVNNGAFNWSRPAP